MREILFRGKRIDNGEWVEGYYVYLYDTKGHKTHRIYTGYAETDCGDYYPEWFEVVPETVGQYTGLKDKNGMRIFEGDIVESIYTKKPYAVCFGEYTYSDDYEDEQSACGWYDTEKCGYATAFGIPDTWAIVIGNIHDNPELLEDDNGEK